MRINSLAFLISLVLHALLVVGCFFVVQDDANKITYAKKIKYAKTYLVTIQKSPYKVVNHNKPKPKSQLRAEVVLPVVKPVVKPKPVVTKAETPKQLKQPKPVKTKFPAKKQKVDEPPPPEPLVKPKQDEQERRKKLIAEEKARQQDELKEALAQEDKKRLAVKPVLAAKPTPATVADDSDEDEPLDILIDESDELSESDKDAMDAVNDDIKKTITDVWSRPLTARRGMEVELVIQLALNGTVVGVEVAKSSGNVEFDNSAVFAVKKIERFDKISTLQGYVFEKNYRRLRLLFKPDDLRL